PSNLDDDNPTPLKNLELSLQDFHRLFYKIQLIINSDLIQRHLQCWVNETLLKVRHVERVMNNIELLSPNKKYSKLIEAQQLQDDCDIQATNIILHGLPPDVYSLINHQEGETLYECYLRFSQLINDMHTIGMTMQQVQVNTKFLNALLPKWSKFVIDVKLHKSLSLDLWASSIIRVLTSPFKGRPIFDQINMEQKVYGFEIGALLIMMAVYGFGFCDELKKTVIGVMIGDEDR
ncbi:hypothetical protein Tco_1561070, partial [Tanacetum coccineum]